MATIQDRAFSREYSGLRNQLAVGGVLAAFCLTGYELMRKKRRGRGLVDNMRAEGVGSVETWEFGYLYQGRCWSKNPSPALPKQPLAWVKQALQVPESSLPELLGIDATLYIRFMKGCWLFTALHTCTTFPTLFSLHIIFSPSSISMESMDKASISSLIQSKHGLNILFVHTILAFWLTVTWVLTLLWVARGTFRYRALAIQTLAEDFSRLASDGLGGEKTQENNRGLRLRTVMVTNVPVQLRDEKALKEYFEYYMSRPLGTAPITPGFIAKIMTFLFNRVATSSAVQYFKAVAVQTVAESSQILQDDERPVIVERIIVARKVTELASLLERRQEILKKLEYAHIRLARKALQAARARLENPASNSETIGLLTRILSRKSLSRGASDLRDAETSTAIEDDLVAQLNLVTETLAPFVSEFNVPPPTSMQNKLSRIRSYIAAQFVSRTDSYSQTTDTKPHDTIWESLHSLPRQCLDAYQPLINLNRLFRGQSVPAIDYYSAKLGLLTALINENRGRALEAYPPASTMFVTFEKVSDARRAVKYLQAHPRNPLACLVVPAPDVADLDWVRVMKSSYTGEFLKDWVIDLGVWVFTCSWIIPISLLVGLVNLDNLSIFIPVLRSYLRKHRDREAISSLLPTVLVSILTILIPVILLLIAKKALTIVTFSKLHDTIMIRYWRFLVCNLLIFFCVGVAALESFLQSFRRSVNPIPLIASSFPTAGPFYVGWLILQTAVHGFLELGLYGLPIILYSSTRAATTLRRRAACIRPRTFNFYYWLPNHVLVMTIVACFALLNPLVTPFALVYFTVESVIVKHQLIHVYAKTYDNNGRLILIRIIRYSLDGFILAQVVFLAFLLVLRETAEAVMIGILLGLTVVTKIVFTHLCRVKFTELDQAEDAIHSGEQQTPAHGDTTHEDEGGTDMASRLATLGSFLPYGSSRFWTWKDPPGVHFSYGFLPSRPHRSTRRGPIPFSRDSKFTSSENRGQPPQKTLSKDDGYPRGFTFPRAGGKSQRPLDSPIREMLPPLTRHNTAAARQDTHPPLVTPHAKHPNWDDTPHLDRPYENPFYAAPVDNYLWLPRNPFGVLDLDDSVDLHQALTSEPGGGKLGKWLTETVDSQPSSLAPAVETLGSVPSPDSHPADSIRDGFPVRVQRQFSGTEEISMSHVLSARANHIELEDEVDQARPHRSSFGGSSYNRRMNYIRRPSTVGRRQTNISSSTNQSSHAIPGPTTSIFSRTSDLPQLPARVSSPASIRDPVNEPDVQAQAVFVESDLSANISVSSRRDSRPINRRQWSTGPPVAMHEAVLGEIIAEEQIEALDRIRREEEEQRLKEARKPSWWNAWLWHRSRPTVDVGVPSDNDIPNE